MHDMRTKLKGEASKCNDYKVEARKGERRLTVG